MDKNTGIGLVLIAALVIGFSILTKPSQEELERESRYQDSIRNVQTTQVIEDITTANSSQSISDQSQVSDFFDVKPSTSADSIESFLDSTNVSTDQNQISEQNIALENSKIRIEFSSTGGQIKSIQLKNYKKYDGDSLILMDSDANLSLELMNKKGIRLNTDRATFTPIKSSPDAQTLVMRMNYSPEQYIDFIYALAPDDYMLNYSIAVVGMENVLSVDCLENFTLKWQQKLRRQEKNEKNEQRYSKIHYRTIDGDFDGLSESSNDNKEITSGTTWIAFKDQFFANVIISDNTFKNAVLDSKMMDSDKYLKDCSATLIFKPQRNDNALVGSFKYFFGPLEYYMLKSYDDGINDASKQLDLDKLIPLGWSLFRLVNKYFIIPLFDLLNSTGMQMGLVIFLLTLIVKLIISPLTYKSFMSSAKMRVLKPQVDELNEKYPGQDKAMERQKAVMQLYSQAGVSPMSGCIPMLLQMPILFALFQFFPSLIELRQENFLWASDLSTYDAIFEWKANIPIISGLLDNHISLFCVLMTATSMLYTKFNMDATNTGQQQMPGMKWMMYLMPVMFLFILNSYPAGLNYYYFISTLISVVTMIVLRKTTNEEKLLAGLEANKAKNKTKKKSGFAARLEAMQKEQERMLKERQKK